MASPSKTKTKTKKIAVPDSDDTLRDDLKLFRSELKNAFAQSEMEDESTRARLLRSSSMPYCGLRDFVIRCEDAEADQRYSSIEGAFYTGVGTIVHSIIQNFLPLYFDKVDILGRWDSKDTCDKKGCPYKKVPIDALNKDGCAKCGKHPIYEEIASYGAYTSHTDNIWVVRGTKRAYIIDFKTTSLSSIYAHRRGGGYYPQKPYVWQLDSYAVHLFKLLKSLGYELYGTIICYIARDRITEYELVNVRHGITEEWINKKAEELNAQATAWRAMSLVIKDGTWDMENAQAFSERKLCSSHKFYMDHVHSNYNPCPLHKVCFKAKERKAALKVAVKKAKATYADK